MTGLPPDPLQQGVPPEGCAHPWLRVTCGECGAAVDALRMESFESREGSPARAQPSTGSGSPALFIVARGHPELVDQLKAVMGDSGPVLVIEDRRRASRGPLSPEDAASAVRTELRKRVLEGESGQNA